MSGFAFSHQFSKRWLTTPTPVKHAIIQELDGLTEDSLALYKEDLMNEGSKLGGVVNEEFIDLYVKEAKESFEDLKRMGIVLKRALYFITCNGRMLYKTRIEEDYISRNLLDIKERLPEGVCRDGMTYKQLSLFDDVKFGFQNQIVGIG